MAGKESATVRDIGANARTRRLAPLVPLYEADRMPVEEADGILSGGWRYDGMPPIRLEVAVPWTEVAQADSAWARELHAWTPIAPLLVAYYATGRPHTLDRAASFALDWVAAHQDNREVLRSGETVELAHRLAFVLDAVTRVPRFGEAQIATLTKALIAHIRAGVSLERREPSGEEALVEPLALLLALGRFPTLKGVAVARLAAHDLFATTLDRFVASDGGTIEHSPASQRALVELLGPSLRPGVITGQGLSERVRSVVERLPWFVTPGWRLAQIGDTERGLRIAPVDAWYSDHLTYVASKGDSGTVPEAKALALPDSGWFIVRDPAPTLRRPLSGSSYVAQICGRHSTRHKHDDDFSFVWFERRRAVLADGGRYGFFDPVDPSSKLYKPGVRYADPKRLYVESARAHNVVTIDEGLGEPPQPRPFRSGLKQWGEGPQLHFSLCERRIGRIRHLRLLAIRPGTFLVVIDTLTDTDKVEHEYAQRFLLAPGLEATAAGGVVSAKLDDEVNVYALPFLGAELRGPVQSQEKPQLEGWVSPRTGELEPASAIRFVKRGARAVLATVFWLGSELPEIDPELSRGSTRRIRLGWAGDGRRHQIDVSRDEKLQIGYRAPWI